MIRNVMVRLVRSAKFQVSSVVFLAALAGCGPASIGTVPGGGTVMLDGKPAEGATIVFHPESSEGRPASGTTDASGVFKLTTEISGDGALPGSYKVAVTKWDRPPDNLPAVTNPGDSAQMDAIYKAKEKRGKEPQAKNAVATKYGDPASSGLTATVSKAGPNDFKLEVTSK